MTQVELAKLLPISQEIWQSFALCAQVDPETFYPEKGGSTKEAKRICDECDVKEECKDFALRTDQRFGIWGGLAESERHTLRKQKVANQSRFQ
ncbi:MAG: WhiB family transcriptional regulator [Bifidobacteriaceae bacterium]|jgi:WhiB family redox-sensing transcriptional regulator|nr:WhiB family transcriptional regulator [Bifidobacteriaceae bacterium]